MFNHGIDARIDGGDRLQRASLQLRGADLALAYQGRQAQAIILSVFMELHQIAPVAVEMWEGTAATLGLAV